MANAVRDPLIADAMAGDPKTVLSIAKMLRAGGADRLKLSDGQSVSERAAYLLERFCEAVAPGAQASVAVSVPAALLEDVTAAVAEMDAAWARAEAVIRRTGGIA